MNDPDRFIYHTNKLLISLPSAGEYSSELNKLIDEAFMSIITGDKPISYFDEMVKLYYSNGGEQLTKEANDWYINIK
ncbi:MAG: hypothetical protein GX213_06495 [Clostridiaceae bacterium]|nr:hypothetical protein [Clostridiaceae bacterium]